MNVRGSSLAVVVGLLAGSAYAQTAGMFSVQGLLKDDMGDPITGMVDLQFRLFDAESGGFLVDWNGDGSVDDVVGLDAQEVLDVQVTAGLFVVKPGAPVSPTAFDGNERYLEISVREDVTYVPLSRLEMATALATSEQVNIPASGTPAIEVDGSGNVSIPGTIQVGSTITINGTTDTISSSADLELHVSSGRVLRLETTATSPNIIGGHPSNSVGAFAGGGTVAGGGFPGSPNSVTADYGTVSGGSGNTATAWATVGGGRRNVADEFRATVGGGEWNTASGGNSTVGGGGGISPDQGNKALGHVSTVSGGDTNTASGLWSTVPGGQRNTAGGEFSFAAGQRAKVRDAAEVGDGDGDEGTFVWADSTVADFTSTGPNQFLIRASGGVGIGTTSPGAKLDSLVKTPVDVGVAARNVLVC